MIDKPSSEEYMASAVAQLGCKDFASAEVKYKFNMRAAHQAVTDSRILGQIVAELRSMPIRYAAGRPHLLFYPSIPEDLSLLTKPFRSTIEKLYRSNILYNRQFPNPPRVGFTEPSKLYEEVEDLLRTRLVCKYMDGPRFVCEALTQLCHELGVQSKFRELSTEAGYYAWHYYVRIPVQLILDGTEVVEKNMWVEIQITTQLAEVITALTHELYEARRSAGPVPKDHNWKWDAGSRDFRSAYLGHGLHLLEGVIQNLKDDLLSQSSADAAKQTTDYSPREPDPEQQTSKQSEPSEGEKDC